jgi:hypothetical protein
MGVDAARIFGAIVGFDPEDAPQEAARFPFGFGGRVEDGVTDGAAFSACFSSLRCADS